MPTCSASRVSPPTVNSPNVTGPLSRRCPEPAGYYGKRHRIGHILGTLAELFGDVDAEVEAMSRDLSSAYQYVRIAERYLRDDGHEDALGWAERKTQEFGVTDARLVEITAERYQQAGRGPAAVELLWQVNGRDPDARELPTAGRARPPGRFLAEMARLGTRPGT
jgi:hypothetical protein